MIAGNTIGACPKIIDTAKPRKIAWRIATSRRRTVSARCGQANGQGGPNRGRQTIRMRALEVPLHTFRAQHSAIEWKFLPRLEADDFVVAHLELYAALLPAEAAMSLHEAFGLGTGR